MDAQTAFNTVATHLFKQGRQAVNGLDHCVYRAEDGAQCAAGCLITDEEYSPEMEGRGVGGLKQDGLMPRRLYPILDLLRDLQNSHDDVTSWHGPRQLRQRLQEVATRFGLDASILDTLAFPAPQDAEAA